MFIAERQGFEPRVPRSTTVFKTAAIDHSATSPRLLSKCFISQKRCKSIAFFLNMQSFWTFFLKSTFFFLKTGFIK